MITRIELARLWDEIVPQQDKTVGRRADPHHPLDFFITYDERLNMQLMLLTEYQLELPASSKQIHVRGSKRKIDGQHAVCFSLEDKGLKDQFVSLCWDMMDCSFEIQNKKNAAQAAIKRFRLWQRLFAEAKEKRLSEVEVRGLIGELTVLKEICIPRYGIEKAISGWIGPLGADRDFEFEDTWYESKFVSLSMDKVKISSLDQLDTDAPGELVLCRYEKTANTAIGHITLDSLIYEIANVVSENDNTREAFLNRVSLAGYKAASEQSGQPYIFHRIERYKVDTDDFPRIRRSKLSKAITEGEYQVSIPAIQHWIAR